MGYCCIRLAQKVGLQGMHIDAFTCSYCDDFLKIKTGVSPAGLVTEIKNPGTGEAKPGTTSKRTNAVSDRGNHTDRYSFYRFAYQKLYF